MPSKAVNKKLTAKKNEEKALRKIAPIKKIEEREEFSFGPSEGTDNRDRDKYKDEKVGYYLFLDHCVSVCVYV